MRTLIAFILLAGSASFGNVPGCFDPRDSEAVPGYFALKSDILQNQIKSTDELLRYFANTSKYQSLEAAPILLRGSRALNGGDVTAEVPRILLSGGNLAMHLTGNPKLETSNEVELIEFHPDTDAFTFHFIDFNLFPDPRMFLDQAEVVGTEVSKIYEKHGEFVSCFSCHDGPKDNDLLPNWGLLSDQYRPYGTSEDRIFTGTQEYRDFLKFEETLNNPTAGKLYRQLPIGIRRDVSTGDIIFSNRPNQSFTEHLYAEMGLRTAKKILAAPEYEKLQYAVLGAFLNCDDIEGFFPKMYRKKYDLTLVERIEKQSIGIVFVRQLEERLIKTEEWPRIDGWRKEDALNGTSHSISVGQFLSIAKVPLEKALEFYFDLQNRDYMETTAREAANFGASDLFLKRKTSMEQNYLSPEYLETIGKVGYLALPDLVALTLPEVFGREGEYSYRFYGGSDGPSKLYACYLGERFLRENPDLSFFSDGIVHPSSLLIAKHEFCSKLRKRSLDVIF